MDKVYNKCHEQIFGNGGVDIIESVEDINLSKKKEIQIIKNSVFNLYVLIYI